MKAEDTAGAAPTHGENMKKPRTLTLTLKIDDDRPGEVEDGGDINVELAFEPGLKADEVSYLAPWAERFLTALRGGVDGD